MKGLVLIRHAAAASPTGAGDFDRPLSEAGRREARAMAVRFGAGAKPDLLLTSTARRAVETANILADGAPVEPRPELYTAGVVEVLELLRRLPDEHERVALCGHNPVTADTIRFLTLDFAGRVPTCTVARLDLDVDRWAEVDGGCARLAELETPPDFSA